ncbi:hypothetical protein [Crocosphaera chwakensis]|uniref:Uncharacterized protein n=1 Tax=Crocosphaera chwakensis CCY0110 TaxID=391612 RepID=A3IKB0_9CHRO|nr:hypothetical protein [Crocosphaera chwakensis]EAZ93099.1 hypothetical protein CY0110_03484 [Crocosphaera chwakensis CCY0110]
MNTIPNTTRLTTLEILLKKQLENAALLSVPFSINCFLGEVLLILVDCPHLNCVDLEKIETFLYKILKQENLSHAYFIEIYYYINGEYCFVEVGEPTHLLDKRIDDREMMVSKNTIPNTTRLTTLEILLKKQLENTALLSVPFSINCFLGEVLLILVDCPHLNCVDLEKIEAFLYKILKQENLSHAYFIEIYYYINGEYCFVESNKQPSLLEILAWELFNKDRRIFIKQHRDLIFNWYQKFIDSLNHNFKSNQLSWFVISGSLGTLILLTIFYGLTRPCIFNGCPEIKQAQELSNQTDSLLNNNASNSDFNIARINLESAIKLLNSIPFWSDYYQESSHLKEKYKQKLNNILALNSARDQINKIISLYKNSSLSMEQLETAKQEMETELKKIEMINNNNFLDEIENKNYQNYLQIIDNINDQINLEKQAYKSLQQAEEAALLAQKRENTADQLSDLQLVYNTWVTAIKRLQEIQPNTRIYQSSRSLLKTYLSNQTSVQRRKKQETVAVRLYEKANNYANLAKKAEENNQWSQAVNYWNMAVVYIKKVPQNTFKGNQIQPFISSYNLALNQATNQLKQLTQSKTINAELDTMCTMKQKICDYQITEELIKMKLESQYLEQVWITALQAKAQGNLQIQVELLNHLSTFEHRLQKISNQTGKSIEVYNAQGNLMTVYHRQQ